MVSAPPTIGAVLVALFVAIWLTSSSTHLLSSYIRRTSDPWTWVSAVVFLVLLNTAHTAILSYSTYDYLILHFTDVEYLSTALWPLLAQYSIFVAVSLITQLYFCMKLSTLYAGQKRVYICGTIALFTLGQTAFGIAATYYMATKPAQLYEADLSTLSSDLTLCGMVFALVADLIIFAATFKDMRTARFTVRSESVPAVISRLFVETNSTTLIAVILSLAFYLAWDVQGHPSGVATAFAIIIPKLSLLSMLASVNSGAETIRTGLDSKSMKHVSSLSDMFKGTPLSRSGGVTVSRIGGPFETPIANLYAREGSITPDHPGWLRRTLDPAAEAAPSEHLFPPSQQPPLPRSNSQRSKVDSNRALIAISASIYPLDVTNYYGEQAATSSAIDVQEATPRKGTFDRDEQGEVVLVRDEFGGSEKGGAKSYGFF